MMTFGSSISQKPTNTNSSFEVSNLPSDTISSLAWSPVANHLAVGSWDKTLRVFDVQVTGTASNNVNATPRSLFTLETPVMCCNFARDGQSVLVGCADGKVVACSLASQQTVLIGTHEGPVVGVFQISEMNNLVVSASHDKTIRFFNPATSGAPAVATVGPHSERIYCMDIKFPMLVAVTADRKNYVYNLQTPSQPMAPWRTMEGKLKLQTRAVSCFPDKTGFVIGSVEGRCSINSVSDIDANNKDRNFEYKSHRSADEIYPVHAVDFHPTGVFLTAGGDGNIIIWHMETKSRIKGFNSTNYPVTAAKFSTQGDLLAYAVGYDWAKGHEGGTNVPVKLFVHKLQEVDIKSRSATGSTGNNYNRRR